MSPVLYAEVDDDGVVAGYVWVVGPVAGLVRAGVTLVEATDPLAWLDYLESTRHRLVAA